MPAPTTDPIIWASDTNWSSGPRSGDPLKDTSMSAGVAAQGIVAGQSLKADQLNQALNVATTWIEFLRAEQGLGAFGDGSDGDVTITGGTTTLTRDMYYRNLTVEGTGVLATAGYRVFVSGLLVIEAGGVISHDGADGAFDTAGVGGAAGSVSGISQIAGDGDGSSGIGAGAAGYAHADSLGGAGGAGGTDGAQAGGAGGTAALTASRGGARHYHGQLGCFADGTRLQGGAGGGGGGSASAATSGGGGGGGGVVVISAFAVDSAGTIRAEGGDGADASGGPSGGGGGGGGGGVLLLAYRRLTALGTTSVAGGAGGAALGGAAAGGAGSAGRVLQFVI